jgi:predicted RNA binding protein YcfA (HicA-like mRNA interferase family)
MVANAREARVDLPHRRRPGPALASRHREATYVTIAAALNNPIGSDIMKVRDVVKALDTDGWRLLGVRGSHRQFVHSVKPGRVTVPGHPSDEVHPRTLRSIRRQAGLERIGG